MESSQIIKVIFKRRSFAQQSIKVGNGDFSSFHMRPRCPAGKYPEACVPFIVIRLIFAAVCVPWVGWEVFAYSEVCCWFNWTNLQFMWSPLFSVVYECNPVYGVSILKEFAQIIQKIKTIQFAVCFHKADMSTLFLLFLYFLYLFWFGYLGSLIKKCTWVTIVYFCNRKNVWGQRRVWVL